MFLLSDNACEVYFRVEIVTIYETNYAEIITVYSVDFKEVRTFIMTLIQLVSWNCLNVIALNG